MQDPIPIRELKDPWTLERVGMLNVEFDARQISTWLESRASVKGRIMVLNAQGTVIYDSEDVYYGQTYPYHLEPEKPETGWSWTNPPR